MQIFSTWGTRTWSNLIIVCNGSLVRHDATHSGVGVQIDALLTGFDDTRMLPRCSINTEKNVHLELCIQIPCISSTKSFHSSWQVHPYLCNRSFQRSGRFHLFTLIEWQLWQLFILNLIYGCIITMFICGAKLAKWCLEWMCWFAFSHCGNGWCVKQRCFERSRFSWLSRARAFHWFFNIALILNACDIFFVHREWFRFGRRHVFT